MIMNAQNLRGNAGWEAAGVALPRYDVSAMIDKTKASPVWAHFGAGNIFRGFVAALQQRLLNEGRAEKGIVVAETFDYEIIDRVYTPFDNLTMNVTLNPDATIRCEIIASVAEALKADSGDSARMNRLAEIFTDPGLQLFSLTITEKGYALTRADGGRLPVVKADMAEGPERARHVMSVITALLYRRYMAGQRPIAAVSMDNCSRNGEKLKESVTDIARAWAANGFVDGGFLDYLADESKVSFPWSMIDKITPRPSQAVADMLAKSGVEEMRLVVTEKNTYTAPFVNAERPQYLVIEDKFPNGRPALEKAGVYLADRETVNKVERMKVTACLNPLHTAMSVYGCLLGYTLISEEMKDADIVALIRRLGYVEGLPVVTDPGILSPRAFIDEVVTERLPNPFMPDDPRRIATDTSQKVGIRFGETIKSYLALGRDLDSLTAIPLAIAGWFRYLLAVDDGGNAMEVSPDPMKDELQAQLSGVVWNDPASYSGQIRGILANPVIFGSDLTKTVLADKIETIFAEELAGPGAARAVLRRYLA
ncbi:MAG: mannitol dehydrogenase family protein [Oscillospiraceae bacterium]|jgi:fructuronate reductase|nr:mannitol dehydrogenase family protein [Oscillospiraceae bacterium]